MPLRAELQAGRMSYDYIIDKDYSVCPLTRGNEAAFINTHDKEHINCCARAFLAGGMAHMGIFATRDLVEGEELFLSYGDLYPTPWLDKKKEKQGEANQAG